MFERFTERARQVVILAQEAARKRHHPYIDTPHIFWGLLAEEEGLAARVLRQFKFTTEGFDDWLDGWTADPNTPNYGSDETKRSNQIPFTVRGKKCLELALREALSMGHNYIGTEHILLAVDRLAIDADDELHGPLGDLIQPTGPSVPGSSALRLEVVRLLAGPGGRTKPALNPWLVVQVSEGSATLAAVAPGRTEEEAALYLAQRAPDLNSPSAGEYYVFPTKDAVVVTIETPLVPHVSRPGKAA